jgi:hypothetical protein
MGHPFTQARLAIVEVIAILAQREELAEIIGPGSRSRSATPRYICPDATEWLMPCAAATSAAIASQLSHDQCAQSVGPSARRATSSAMAASRRAAAAASTRAPSVIAATTAASSALRSASASGNRPTPGTQRSPSCG